MPMDEVNTIVKDLVDASKKDNSDGMQLEKFYADIDLIKTNEGAGTDQLRKDFAAVNAEIGKLFAAGVLQDGVFDRSIKGVENYLTVSVDNDINHAVKLGDNVKFGKNAEISYGVIIGDGTEIHDGVVIAKGSEIGNNVKLMDGAWVDPGVEISNGVQIDSQAVIGMGSQIGDNAHIGSGTRIDSSYSFPTTVSKGSEIGTNVQIGRAAEIEPWAKIGDNSIIGPRADIGAKSHLGNFVKVDAGAMVGAESSVGDNVHFLPGSSAAGDVDANSTIEGQHAGK